MQGDSYWAGLAVILWTMSPSLTRFLGKTVLWIFLFAFSVSASHILPSPTLPSPFPSPTPHARALCGDKRLEKSTYWNTGREILTSSQTKGVLKTRKLPKVSSKMPAWAMNKILACFFFMGQSLWGEIVPLISLPKMLMAKEKLLSCSLCQRTSTRLGRRAAPRGCLDSMELYGISVCTDQGEFVCTADGDRAHITSISAQTRMCAQKNECTGKTGATQRRVNVWVWVWWRVCTEQSECAQKMSVHTLEWVCTGQSASAS